MTRQHHLVLAQSSKLMPARARFDHGAGREKRLTRLPSGSRKRVACCPTARSSAGAQPSLDDAEILGPERSTRRPLDQRFCLDDPVAPERAKTIAEPTPLDQVPVVTLAGEPHRFDVPLGRATIAVGVGDPKDLSGPQGCIQTTRRTGGLLVAEQIDARSQVGRLSQSAIVGDCDDLPGEPRVRGNGHEPLRSLLT